MNVFNINHLIMDIDYLWSLSAKDLYDIARSRNYKYYKNLRIDHLVRYIVTGIRPLKPLHKTVDYLSLDFYPEIPFDEFDPVTRGIAILDRDDCILVQGLNLTGRFNSVQDCTELMIYEWNPIPLWIISKSDQGYTDFMEWHSSIYRPHVKSLFRCVADAINSIDISDMSLLPLPEQILSKLRYYERYLL